MDTIIYSVFAVALVGIPVFFSWLGKPDMTKYLQMIFGTVLLSLAILVPVSILVESVEGIVWGVNAPMEAQHGGFPIQSLLVLMGMIYTSIWLYQLFRKNLERQYKTFGRRMARLMMAICIIALFFEPGVYSYLLLGASILAVGNVLMAKDSKYLGHMYLTFLILLPFWIVMRLILIDAQVLTFNVVQIFGFQPFGFAIEDALMPLIITHVSIPIFELMKKWFRSPDAI